METLIISDSQAQKRLDVVLAEVYSEYSRSKLQTLLTKGLVSVDGSFKIKGNLKVKLGNVIEINKSAIDGLKVTNENYQPEPQDLDVVYQDDDVIIINKPANLVVHPAAGNWTGTLVNGLLYNFPELAKLPRAGIVHRLDKDTTGLMVVARNLIAHTKLIKQLQARTVTRKYVALVNGHLITGGVINANISRHPHNRLKMAVVDPHKFCVKDGVDEEESITSHGKEAITQYKVLKKYPKHTLIELKLETGRTHQIRVHMAHLGYPVVGDSLYGRAYAAPKTETQEEAAIWQAFKRQALTAVELGFIHPKTDEYVSWKIDLPRDMQGLLAILDKLI